MQHDATIHDIPRPKTDTGTANGRPDRFGARKWREGYVTGMRWAKQVATPGQRRRLAEFDGVIPADYQDPGWFVARVALGAEAYEQEGRHGVSGVLDSMNSDRPDLSKTFWEGFVEGVSEVGEAAA